MDYSNDYGPICNLKQAESLLGGYCCFDIINIEDLLGKIFTHKEYWSSFEQIEEDIKESLHETYGVLHLHFRDHNLQMALKASLDCMLFNKLHDFLVSLLHHIFERDDRHFLDKCVELCSENVTAEQLGAPEDYAIPFLAAVVELSSLDHHKSPLEKLQCLCTTYDLIFAELKTALIDIISKFSSTAIRRSLIGADFDFSDSESEIPVVNNSDIIPILMLVIVRSKLLHVFSNMHYIEAFVGCLKDNDTMRHVFGSFKEAVHQLEGVTKESLKPKCEKVCRDLDLIRLMKMLEEINSNNKGPGMMTPLDGQLLRITDLIVTSTNESHNVE